MVAILIIMVSCIIMIIEDELILSLDIIASIICIGLFSLIISIFFIRRMREAPLLAELFKDSEFTIYFSEYIDLSGPYKDSLPRCME